MAERLTGGHLYAPLGGAGHPGGLPFYCALIYVAAAYSFGIQFGYQAVSKLDTKTEAYTNKSLDTKAGPLAPVVIGVQWCAQLR